MREVSIIGAYEINWGVLKNRSFRDMISEAGICAIKDAGVESKGIEFIYASNFAAPDFTGQNQIASYAATTLGIPDIPGMRIEGACASGGLAIREAFHAIRHRIYDIVLVIGVEKMHTKESTSETMDIIGRGNDLEIEQSVGINGPVGFALPATRHMYEYKTTKEHFAYVALKNYANGLKNPVCHLRKKVTLEDILNARIISYPLGLHDCSLVTDGAAAIVLCPKDMARRFNSSPVDIIASGVGSTSFNFAEKNSLTSFEATVRAANEAYKQAKLIPEDIDFCECHDCFTSTEIINIEDLGFVKAGEGGPATKSGYTLPDGKIPVNTSGGLKSKGHPIGATGVGQAVEVVKQMRGKAKERQLKRTDIALTHLIGGPATLAAVHIFKKGF